MPNKESASGKQQQRFAAYLDSLARAARHADRSEPLKAYCRGLLLPIERKCVEPMAARLAPHNVRRTHQSLHHLVADSPWDDDALLAAVLGRVLQAMKKTSPVVAWIVDDTSFPKKGKHSVGVAHQYCGQLGKQENCRVAVSLSVATSKASLPIAYRLYLPASWADDRKRRRKTRVPDEIRLETKPQIALGQIRQALEDDIEPGVVLADAAYGNDSAFQPAKGPTMHQRWAAHEQPVVNVCSGDSQPFFERAKDSGKLLIPWTREKGWQSPKGSFELPPRAARGY